MQSWPLILDAPQITDLPEIFATNVPTIIELNIRSTSFSIAWVGFDFASYHIIVVEIIGNDRNIILDNCTIAHGFDQSSTQ